MPPESKSVDPSPARTDKTRQRIREEFLEDQMSYQQTLSDTKKWLRMPVLVLAAGVPLVLLVLAGLELFHWQKLEGVEKAVAISVAVLSFVVLYTVLLRAIFESPKLGGLSSDDAKTIQQTITDETPN